VSATSDFYLNRATEAAREAREAVLDNVRERSLRSEAAWLTMAERLTRAEAMRAQQVAEKARDAIGVPELAGAK
jgi:hypothetical protein